jgi:hypothetical protein
MQSYINKAEAEGSQFEEVAVIGEISVNVRTSYVFSLIEHKTAHRRRLIEVRVWRDDQPTRWTFRFEPRVTPGAVELLERGMRMAEEI